MTRPPSDPDDIGWIDGMLDDLASAPVPDVSDALMARVLAEGTALMPAPGGAGARAPMWRQIVGALGGWGAVGGVVAAAATGFVVGFGGLEQVGVDPLWSLDYQVYDGARSGVDAFGWDMEEG